MSSPPALIESQDSIPQEILASNDARDDIPLLIKRRMLLSKRQGSWFRLSLQERSIIDLSLKLKVKFRSLDLIRAVVSVLKKLRDAARPPNRDLSRGRKMARAFSEAAVNWGNAKAREWRWDLLYIAFLGRTLRS